MPSGSHAVEYGICLESVLYVVYHKSKCPEDSVGFGCPRISISYSSLCSYYGKVYKASVPCQQGHTPGEQANRFSQGNT